MADNQSSKKNAEVDDDSKPTSYWMEKKLDYSQQILRSLAMGDLEEVKINASRMNLLNKVEGFVRNKNPAYRRHLRMFNHVTGDLAGHAEKGNIEGATLAFNQLTVSCVECHKSLRSESGAATSAQSKTKDLPENSK